MSFQADEVFDLFDCFFGLSPGQIDLIDHGNEFEVVFNRKVGIRERLRLDALRSIDDEQCAFTGGKRT